MSSLWQTVEENGDTGHGEGVSTDAVEVNNDAGYGECVSTTTTPTTTHTDGQGATTLAGVSVAGILWAKEEPKFVEQHIGLTCHRAS